MAKTLERIKVNILLVGGGIVGVLAADYFAELGLDVLLLRVSDELAPQSDTLSNHGWKHTGPWYWLKWIEQNQPFHLLTALRTWGDEMLERYQIQPGAGPAIFRTSDANRARLIEETADRLHYPLKIYTPEEAKELLGSRYVPGGRDFGVLDRPFNPANVIRMARNSALYRKARMRDLTIQGRVRLIRDKSSPNGFVVQVADKTIEAGLTILSSGAGTPELLEQLDLIHQLKVFRSILFISPTQELGECTLSGDMDSGFTVVRHQSHLSPTGSFEVISAGGRVEIDGPVWAQRKPSPEEIERLLGLMPERVRDAIEQAGYDATAGLKTEAQDSLGESHAVPYVELINRDGIKNLCVAIPGKATFGLYTVVRRIAPECGLVKNDDLIDETDAGLDDDVEPKIEEAPTSLPGDKWMAMPKMHWDYPRQAPQDDNGNSKK